MHSETSTLGVKKNNTEATYFLFKKMWEFSKGNRKVLVWVIISFVISNSIMLLEPLVLASFLNEVQKNGATKENFFVLFFIIMSGIGIRLLFWLFHGTARILERKNAFLVRYNYQNFLVKKVLGFDLSWHNNKQSGDTIDKINKSSWALFQFSKDIYEIIEFFIKIIGTTLVLAFFNIWLSIIVLIMLLIIFGVTFSFDQKLFPQYKEMNFFENKVSAKVFDVFSNITSVIILNIQKLVKKDISKAILEQEPVYQRNSVLNEKKWFVGGMLFQITLAGTFIFYVWYSLFIQNKVLEIGIMTALYMYLSNLIYVFWGFAGIYGELVQKKASVENAESIEYFEEKNIVTKKSFKNFETLKVENMSFAYDKEKTILENINVEIKSGEKIALVGESGSGKTTFLKLLHGLHEFESGKVLVNEKEYFGSFVGIDLQTTLVPQEPELFTASIRENITFGLDYTDEYLQKFTKMACFEEVILGLPHLLESKINEKGVNLSGGQKQRLALARALLFAENKNIILLDESTSSVDPKNEEKIYKNILKNFSKKTIISSIHKLNLLKFFDRIILFESGKVVADGSLEKLLEKNNEFKEMWEEFRE